MTKPTELDENRLLDSQMTEHYRVHMLKLVSGCSGECNQGRRCTCAPREEMACADPARDPEPRRPHLPLLTRLHLWMSRWWP